MSDVDSFDPDVLRVEAEVRALRKSALTARRLDEVVLEAAGFDANAESRRAERASLDLHSQLDDRLRQRLGIRRPRGGPFGCVLLLAVVPAAGAVGTIFGRHPAEHWTKLLSVGAPLAAAALLLTALIGNVRPMSRRVADGMTVVLGIYGVTAVLGLRRLALEDWERTSILAALGVGVVAVLWLHGVRLIRRDDARELDAAPVEEASRTKQELAAARDRLVGELEERLRGAGADLDELDALRAHAQSVAEARGVTGLDSAPGPVGSSIIADILTFDVMVFDED